MVLACPSCGNERNFQVKTLQVHVLQVEDAGVGLLEEGQPAVLELLCDECEATLDFGGIDEGLRRRVLLTLGAR